MPHAGLGCVVGPARFPQGLLGGPETAHPLPNAADLLVWCSPPIVPPNLPPRARAAGHTQTSATLGGQVVGLSSEDGLAWEASSQRSPWEPSCSLGGGGWMGALRNRRMASRAGGLGVGPALVLTAFLLSPQCAPPDCLRSRLGGQTPSEPLQGAPPDPLTESHVCPGHLVGAPQLTPCCLVVQPRSGPGPHHTEGPCLRWAAEPGRRASRAAGALEGRVRGASGVAVMGGGTRGPVG